MILKNRLLLLFRLAMFPIVLGTATLVAPQVEAAQSPLYKYGEIRLYMQPGVPPADVQTLADQVQPASFQPLPLVADAYVMTLPAKRVTEQDTTAAVAVLKADPRVRWASATPMRNFFQASTAPKVEPNDPRYVTGEQWNLKLIHMPQAWVLQKGAKNVNLGWLDSGFDIKHEDALGRFDPGSADARANPIVPGSSIAVDTVDHGVFTSGIAIANTNNNIGIAGICWQNVNCVAMKLGDTPDPTAEMNAFAYILANHDKLHIVAVNMSFGGPVADPVEQAAIQKLIDAGILMVASAGNSGGAGNPIEYPSGYPGVISVSAVDRFGVLTPYSEFGKVEIAAPGGNMNTTGTPQDGVLSLANNSGYQFQDGTSGAAPHVTAVIGLLMSVPGVTSKVAENALFKSANHSGLGTLPDAKYGFGLLDAFGALSLVSVQAFITSPDGLNAQGQSSDPANILPPPVETFKPTVSFHINNLTCDAVTFTLDASIPALTKVVKLSDLISGNIPPGISDFNIVGACTGVANPQYDVSFRVTYPTSGSFQHTVTVNGTDPNSGIAASDTRIFTITPHVIPAGLSMISIPYFESATDSPPPYTGQFRDVPQLLGTTPTLYRYLLPSEIGSQPGKVAGSYAKYTATDPAANINASFRPLNSAPETSPQLTTAAGQPLDTRPVGLGFFIDAPAAISVVDFGVSIPTTPFRIPLHEGWNMVGDPYPFSIPFNSTEIETTTGVRVPIAQAVDQGLILPHIYRLVGGDYQFRTLPDGTLEAWEGHWIYVVPKDPANLNSNTVLNLITTPTPITGTSGRAAAPRTAPAATRASGAGSWTVQLQAHVGDQNDSNNFIGMSATATDGNDKTKVPKPPKPTNAVSLGIIRSNSPATVYAQDLRPISGTKQWDVVVNTDRPNTIVTLDWSNSRTLPHTYRLILTDNVTGQTVDLRNTSSYQYNSGANAGTRSFSLVARPTSAISGHPVFSNVVVIPGRSADGRATNIFDIGYTVSGDVHVSVSILTLGGRQLAQVGTTRAVTTGDNHLTWNGRDNAGRAVPAGSYVLQLQAVTTDGQTTRVIQPLILTGR